MLVLSRKVGDEIVVGNDIRVTVVEIRGGRVRLGFEASNVIPIRRSELIRRAAADDELENDNRPGCCMSEWLELCFELMGNKGPNGSADQQVSWNERV